MTSKYVTFCDQCNELMYDKPQKDYVTISGSVLKFTVGGFQKSENGTLKTWGQLDFCHPVCFMKFFELTISAIHAQNHKEKDPSPSNQMGQVVESAAEMVVSGESAMPEDLYKAAPTTSVPFDYKYKKQC